MTNAAAAIYAVFALVFSLLASQLGPWLALRYFTRFRPDVHTIKVADVSVLFPGARLPDDMDMEEPLDAAKGSGSVVERDHNKSND